LTRELRSAKIDRYFDPRATVAERSQIVTPTNAVQAILYERRALLAARIEMILASGDDLDVTKLASHCRRSPTRGNTSSK
jgi:hypothetical protein